MPSKGISIAGRKNFIPTDSYMTPSNAVYPLLDVETFSGDVLEPCCGEGAISRILEKEHFNVKSFDIRKDESVYGETSIDFLDYRGQHDNIITNPPYMIAESFTRHCLTTATKKVALLLKLTFLESLKRKDFFDVFPPARIWVFRDRITMYPFGEDRPKNSGTITYAWFVWEIGNKSKPKIGWIQKSKEF